MYKYIILCAFLCLSGVICDLNIPEGGECEWDGAKGVCVKETRCLTTLDDRSEKAPVCSKKGEETYICCTDCELVNDTRNAVISPSGSLFWKDGRKARDNCLQYLVDLPYLCRGSYYGGLKREPVAEGAKCHAFSLWAVGGPPPPNTEEQAQYPHQALLGFGKDLESAKWSAGGTIISDRFILTAAHPSNFYKDEGGLSFIAVNVKNLRDPPSNWQTHKIKRVITHPEYKPSEYYNDIALIEIETPIVFNKDVSPACLHVDQDINTDQAIATTWKSLEVGNRKMADTIQTINLENFGDDACKKAYESARKIKFGYNADTQMCYGSKTKPTEACKGLSGEPLMVNNQISHCIYTVIGITSFGRSTCSEGSYIPDVYTRVAPFVPWVETVVWP